MTLVERVKRILLQPKQEWEVISGETATTADLYKSYAIPLAAIGPVASIIGMSIFGMGMPFGPAFRVPMITAVFTAVVHFVLALVGVYVLALIIDFLAPTFSGEKNPGQSLKLAVYSSTAAWMAGVFVIIPALGFLGITGLYSLYLLYEGIPVLMKTPREKALLYTVAVAVAAIVVILDQASKRIIWEVYSQTGGTDLIDGVLRISLSKNAGAVLGILSGSRALLISVTILSVVVLILFAHRMRFAPVSKRVYIGLIFGGAFGNLIDRIATGEVLDFIDMGIGPYRWPTYNVADIAVTVGAVLLIYGFIRHSGIERESEGPAGGDSEPDPLAHPESDAE